MPTQVNACDCLNAIGDFASAMIELEELFYTGKEYDENEHPEGENAEEVAVARQNAHDALTKAEKLCGHNRAGDARSLVQDLSDEWEQDLQVDPHDVAVTMAVLDLARQIKQKGGCSNG